MAERIRPEEAAQALTEIDRQQEQVIRLAIIPTWFWWAIAVLMVAFTAGVETEQGLVIGISTAVFVTGVLAATGWVTFRTIRHARVRNDLIRPGGVLAILGFVALTDGVALAVSLGLKSSGAPYPGTIGVSVAAVMFVVGGPILTKYLYGLMLANRSGSRR